jgi:hypothetical protein
MIQIRSFTVSGYRSLAKLRLAQLGQFNVFYGINGAGKSNILSALALSFDLLHGFANSQQTLRSTWRVPSDLISDDDRTFHSVPHTVFGAYVKCRNQLSPQASVTSLAFELRIDWPSRELRLTRLSIDKIPMTELLEGANALTNHQIRLLGSDNRDRGDRLVLEFLKRVSVAPFAIVNSARVPAAESRNPAEAQEAATRRSLFGDAAPPALIDLLSSGQLKAALFLASHHPSFRVRNRYRAFKRLLRSSPFNRPAFDVTYSERTHKIELREDLGRGDIALDLQGLGIFQVYSILAQATLSTASIIGLEEPEAHLHAPTTGRQLREALVQLVTTRTIRQLFVATHSNLFDLDPTGYFDVSRDSDGTTRVARRPLSDIDKYHLYEPGPAKHALAGFLSYLPSDEVVYRTSDGAPITATEMLAMLQADTDEAVSFLSDVHAAAVRLVTLRKGQRSE